MADVLYVGLQDDDKIVTFSIDAGAAKLVPRAETPAVGAPSVFAVSPDRRALYVGYRGTPGIESWRIDSASGALTSPGRVGTEHPPTYLTADRAGKYLLSAYYRGAYAAVHRFGSDGAVSGPAFDRHLIGPLWAGRALGHRPEILSKSMRPVKVIRHGLFRERTRVEHTSSGRARAPLRFIAEPPHDLSGLTDVRLA